MPNNNPLRFRPSVFEFFLLGGLFVSDQLTKTAFIFSADRFVRNQGGAWGSDIPNTVFLTFVPVFLVGFFVWWLRERNAFLRLSLVPLIAGGIGNMSDRIFFGYVRDFRVVSWFPAFNLADTFLTLGILFLFFSVFLTKKGFGKPLSRILLFCLRTDRTADGGDDGVIHDGR